MSKTPCIVITRDRASLARPCLASLERFVDEIDIHVVDHGSTYPAMLDLLDGCPHPVHRAGDNSPRALWDSPELERIVGRDRTYLVTDPDLVFDAGCPSDWLNALKIEYVEQSRGTEIKVGMGLRIDDIPLNTAMGREVLAWESGFWQTRTRSERSFHAPVDTTMALYPPLVKQPSFQLAPAVRLDAPYLMRHLPWYGYEEEQPEETAYYREHAIVGSSHWINGGWR